MPIPFPKANGGAVPLVGQALALSSWTMSVVVECTCGPTGRGGIVTLTAQQDHTGLRQLPGLCPICGHTVAMKRISMDQAGHFIFEFDRADRRPDAGPVDTTSHHSPAS